LITRFGARTVVFPGLALIIAGLVLFARAPAHGSYVGDLSSQSRTLLSRLGGGPLDVMLSGRGVTRNIVTLQPAGGR
jgi:hypothetical protein